MRGKNINFAPRNMLPEQFTTRMRAMLGDEYGAFEHSLLEEPPPVSIRVNPLKRPASSENELSAPTDNVVPWCRTGYYLERRPSFTFDPLFHAGAYYVQEASSMYIEQLVLQILKECDTLEALDLCAAPGGKATHLLTLLPKGSHLTANEVIRSRCNILVENIVKWGYPAVTVTNNEPRDFAKMQGCYDLIVADLPCSGEGMFRKDIASRKEWSLDNVKMCAARQRRIISEVWDALREGGWLIYSTCTYNREENEENIDYIVNELGARQTGEAVRFYPHRSKGEGFFICLLQKNGALVSSRSMKSASKKRQALRVVYELCIPADVNGCSTELVLNTAFDHSRFPSVELSYEQAIRYLRREALILPSGTEKGFVVMTYKSLPIGAVKNIGSRANNLYPKEWRIRRS
jgi:16S rRNA C967 or C1407 C5-methylase (RsmB/RsmF family)